MYRSCWTFGLDHQMCVCDTLQHTATHYNVLQRTASIDNRCMWQNRFSQACLNLCRQMCIHLGLRLCVCECAYEYEYESMLVFVCIYRSMCVCDTEYACITRTVCAYCVNSISGEKVTLRSIYEKIMARTWISHVIYLNGLCHTHNWVTSHIWMSHVRYMNWSCHTYEWIM